MSDATHAFEQLWRHVLEHWEEVEAHTAFLQTCQNLRLLPDAAARYRGMCGDPERRVVAEQRLQALMLMALAAMETERTAPPREARSRLPLLVATAVLCGLLLLAYLLYV
jgi:hypothetical protein